MLYERRQGPAIEARPARLKEQDEKGVKELALSEKYGSGEQCAGECHGCEQG
jgi:hypothetical protein